MNSVKVYDMVETNFDHNGLRPLTPTKCEIIEEFNGKYELTLEHLCDDDKNWTALKEFNIVKADGQLFRIYKTTTKMSSSGIATHTAYARHIFYDLGDLLVKYCQVSEMNCQSALDHIHNCIFDNNQDGFLLYSFTHYSDIEDVGFESTYEMTSPVACILGEDNSVVNRFDGELYRDNFYYSVCKTKENSQQNAFIIKYGLNMLEVQADVDYSDFCTYLHTEDNYNNQYDVSYIPTGTFPHHVTRGLVFNYNENNIDVLGKDMSDWFGEHWLPKITYSVKFANLHNAELYKDFINLKNFGVGDTGIIKHERLGIETTQRIISRTYDVLNDEVTSITLGNFKNSITRRQRYSNTIARKDNLMRRIISPYTSTDVTQEEFNNLNEFKDNHTYFVYGDDSQ